MKLTSFLFVLCFQLINGFNSNHSDQQNWVKFFNSSKFWFNENGKYFIEKIKENEINSKLNKKCANNLIQMIDNFSQELWAAKMLDSNGHLPSGILSGSLTDLGDFDQCIKISELVEQNVKIEGKYCLLTIRPIKQNNLRQLSINDSIVGSNWFTKEVNDWLEFDNHFSFSNGICIPSDCEPKEIEFLLKQMFQVLNYFNSEVNYCQTKEAPTYRPQIYISLIIIQAMLVLVVLGTILECLSTPNYLIWNGLKCFSLVKNTKILFKISIEKSDNEYRLQFIHGLRVLGTIWVILAHSSGFILVTILVKVSPFARYPDDAIENSKKILAQYVLNASLAVQIFFIMSGFLTVYSTLVKKKLEISFFQFVILRWLRFTPPLIGMMCLTTSLEMLGSGPLFQSELLKPFLDPCYDNWWAHLLYIINWFDLRQMCGIQTWYLGADFQLHIISFVVIYFFYKNQSISHWISYLMIFLGAFIPIILVSTKFGLPRVDVLFKPKYDVPGLETTLFFFGTHMHFISYFSGTILGFALLNRKFISINTFFNRLIWGLTTVLIITIPILSYPIMQEDVHPMNYDISNAVAVSVMLIIWSLCLYWIIYNCAINRADLLSKILSAHILHPLSRLSFCAYLTHLMLIWFNVQQVRNPISINVITISQYFCTILVQTFALGLFLYLTFEAPFVNIIKLLFLKSKQEVRRRGDDDDNNNSVNSQNTISLKNV